MKTQIAKVNIFARFSVCLVLIFLSLLFFSQLGFDDVLIVELSHSFNFCVCILCLVCLFIYLVNFFIWFINAWPFGIAFEFLITQTRYIIGHTFQKNILSCTTQYKNNQSKSSDYGSAYPRCEHAHVRIYQLFRDVIDGRNFEFSFLWKKKLLSQLQHGYGRLKSFKCDWPPAHGCALSISWKAFVRCDSRAFSAKQDYECASYVIIDVYQLILVVFIGCTHTHYAWHIRWLKSAQHTLHIN